MTENNVTTSDFSTQAIPSKCRFQDLTGQQFGRLTVLGYHGKSRKLATWVCKCQCGKRKIVYNGNLQNGSTVSCGCYQNECRIRRSVTHNESRKQQHTPEYKAYTGAKTRCKNSNIESFPSYGGRGIKFLFESYEDFLAEVGRKPTPNHSLDRIDVNGHYEKGNVRWATAAEQGRNKRHNRWIVINNITKTLSEWSEIIGIHHQVFSNRIKNKWCDDCLVKPPNQGGCTHR